MCRTLSCEVVQVDESTVRVLFGKDGEDSHRVIREQHGIGEDNGTLRHRYHVPMECYPTQSLNDFDSFVLAFDDGVERPDWFTDSMMEQVRSACLIEWGSRWDGKTLTAGGGLYLPRLTTIAKGVTLTAGGSLNLPRLTTIAKGVTLTAGGSLNLSSLTTIPEGVNLTAGGGLYLDSLSTLEKGVTITAGGGLYLPRLTTIAKGVTLTAGSYLNLDSLTTIPEGVMVQCQCQHIKLSGQYLKKFNAK